MICGSVTAANMLAVTGLAMNLSAVGLSQFASAPLVSGVSASVLLTELTGPVNEISASIRCGRRL
jgi:hypothetical protein